MPWLISAAQVDKFRKNQKSLIILDATAHMPEDHRQASQEFIQKHIVGAQFFDIHDFCDPSSGLPNMVLRDEKQISEKLGSLGIKNDYKIIFYDHSNLHTACRALWMFKFFGHNPQQLYILDGGLAAWERYGGKIESGPVQFGAKPYTAHLQLEHLRTLPQMKENMVNPSAQVIDLRHATRFCGAPESRPNLRAGHIPKSYSLPFQVLFDKEGSFLPLDKIRRRFHDMGLDLASPIITTCGSGTTAPILNFILDIINHPQHALYNGSWSEWGYEGLYPGETSLKERPVETCLDEAY